MGYVAAADSVRPEVYLLPALSDLWTEAVAEHQQASQAARRCAGNAGSEADSQTLVADLLADHW
jgi:hypothetical protein